MIIEKRMTVYRVCWICGLKLRIKGKARKRFCFYYGQSQMRSYFGMLARVKNFRSFKKPVSH